MTTWKPTAELRFKGYPIKGFINNVIYKLEQLWVNNEGGKEWRIVPMID